MRLLNFKLIIIVLFISINFIGCNKSIKIAGENNNSEFGNLFELSERVYDSAADEDNLIDEYISALSSFIAANKNLECLQNNKGIELIAAPCEINDFGVTLIRYDGNPIGLGTLERTWTFLQIIKGDKIEVYVLYARAAEYPIEIKAAALDNKDILVSIAGVTNVSRSNTAFMSFWIYNSDELKSYEDIRVDTDRGWLQSNEYYIELFDDEMQNLNADEKGVLHTIAGNDFKVNCALENNTVIINSIEVDTY